MLRPGNGLRFSKPSRYSHHMIKETGEFVINLTTEELAYATDYCGVKSGKMRTSLRMHH